MIISLTAFGQVCDTISGKIINCVDSLGQKQGNWEIYKKKIIESSYNGLGSKEGCHYSEKIELIPIAKGNFKDNKKIGTWDYYHKNDHSIFIEKQITYNPDGSIVEENLLKNYLLEFNGDSSIVTGYYYVNQDSIFINCRNKKCTLFLSNGSEINSFPFEEYPHLEYELYKISLGYYEREIKILKNTR